MEDWSSSSDDGFLMWLVNEDSNFCMGIASEACRAVGISAV